MAELPAVRPPSRGELIRFDVAVGLPTALSVLRRHLGLGVLLRVGGRYLVASLRDPLASISTEGWPPARETLVRHQLRAAVRVDDALAAVGFDLDARLPILRAVIAQTGAGFIGANVPMPTVGAWTKARPEARGRFAREVVQRFFNAETAALETGPSAFAFDVSRCRFAELCRALSRPYLAPLFCEADSVYFERPESPLRLLREDTLATGGARCDFRFRISDGEAR